MNSGQPPFVCLKGSDWRKWDLQVQTRLDQNYSCLGPGLPSEQLQKLIDETGLSEAEIRSQEKTISAEQYAKLFIKYVDLFTDIDVMAITDHNNGVELDYLIAESSKASREITILPGVEVASTHGLHILCVFDPSKNWRATWASSIDHFLTQIDLTDARFNDQGQPVNSPLTSQKILEEVNNRNGLCIFAHIGTDNGLFKHSNSASGGTAHINVYKHRLCQIVQIPHSGSLRDGVTNIIEGADPQYGNKSVTKIKTSDARKLSDIASHFTWVKADPTFEGLKQIIFEPETRVYIGPDKPTHSPNVIDTIKFGVPGKSKVAHDKFCFAGEAGEYCLSPYFNCFIGGRGSGKSTVLNFLGLRSIHSESSKNFWSMLEPSFDPEDDAIFSTSGTEYFEFLGQSEIEQFARDKIRFTQAIYDRANAHAGNILQDFEREVGGLHTKLASIIQDIAEVKKLEEDRRERKKQKRTLENSIDVISSDKYTEIVNAISGKTKELQALRSWRERIETLRATLKDLSLGESGFVPNEENADSDVPVPENSFLQLYVEAYGQAISKVGEAAIVLNEDNFAEALNEEKRLQKAIEDDESEAKKILEGAKLSPENVEQVKSAPQQITMLKHEIGQLKIKIDKKEVAIKQYESVLLALEQTKTNFEKQISDILKPLKVILEKQFEENEGRDIKQITLAYEFNDSVAWKALASEYYQYFKESYGDGERSDKVIEFICEHKDKFTGDQLGAVQALIKNQNPNKYLEFMAEIFKDERNYKIFCAIRDKHLHDVKKYKLIQVKYDEKDIEQASFGQRCTAVVVILLLFGNYPLIIDEPEAHLDSSLIANYLVPLIKAKKPDRQLIIATHNANFVVNGDAEKIFILKNETGKTHIVEATIEDESNRGELLKLEGGKEAFEKRGEKLNIVLEQS